MKRDWEWDSSSKVKQTFAGTPCKPWSVCVRYYNILTLVGRRSEEDNYLPCDINNLQRCYRCKQALYKIKLPVCRGYHQQRIEIPWSEFTLRDVQFRMSKDLPEILPSIPNTCMDTLWTVVHDWYFCVATARWDWPRSPWFIKSKAYPLLGWGWINFMFVTYAQLALLMV